MRQYLKDKQSFKYLQNLKIRSFKNTTNTPFRVWSNFLNASTYSIELATQPQTKSPFDFVKKALLFFCREDRIRTCDPLVPNQVRYRPALLPETFTGVPLTAGLLSETSKGRQR
jgi:hypothetical protein